MARTKTITTAADTKVLNDAEVKTLEELIADVTADQVSEKLGDVNAAFDTRSAFEKLTGAGNDSIQDKLKAERKRMALPGIAALMCATNVPAELINREINAGKRFNIYAIGKLNDLMHGLNSGHVHNAINISVMRSLFKFRKLGLQFNGNAVLGAVSDKVKIDKAMAAVLIRHTVSASTAPTQASSTMNALQALNVVRNVGSVKFPIWEVQDTPTARKFEALMDKIAA